jgi:hypothetical protein
MEQAREHISRMHRLASGGAGAAMVDHLEARLALLDRSSAREAIPLARRALAYLDAHPGEQYPDRVNVLSDLAQAETGAQQAAVGEQHARQAVREATARYGERHNYSMNALVMLVIALRFNGKPQEALETVDKLIAIQRQFPKPPFELTVSLQFRALLLGQKPGRPGELDAWREAYQVALLYYSKDYLRCLSLHSNYLLSRVRDGKDKTAIPDIEDIAQNCKGGSPEDSLNFSMALTEAYQLSGQLDRAEAAAREAVRRAHFFKRGDGWICWPEKALAAILMARRQHLDEAQALFNASRAEYLQVYGPKDNLAVQGIDANLSKLAALRAEMAGR